MLKSVYGDILFNVEDRWIGSSDEVLQGFFCNFNGIFVKVALVASLMARLELQNVEQKLLYPENETIHKLTLSIV